nr:ribonuclease H-like domain-containing protein [Tanacetum cinerariifolium]
MITRSQSGIVKPIDRLSLNTFLISPIPKNPSNALRNPQWRNAMYDEYNALIKNGTWLLVPRPAGVNMVRSVWLFKHKFHADGTLSRFKAHLVANGSSQKLGVILMRLLAQLSNQPLFTWFLALMCLRKYALQLLERAHMVHCNPSRTPVDTESKPGLEGVPIQDPTLYRSLAGSYSILHLLVQICLMSFSMSAVICMIRGSLTLLLLSVSCDMLGTVDFGLQLYAFATTSLVGYTDADWAGCPSTRRSTSGYCVFLGDNILSWSAKRQHTLSRSSAKAEYRGVANVVAETAWLRNLLRGLHSSLSTVTLVYCDNVSAIYIVLHLPSRYQYADIFTKGLPSTLFEEFRSSLSVRPSPAPTAGAY